MSDSTYLFGAATPRWRVSGLMLLAMASTMVTGNIAARDRGDELIAEGFAEPYRTIDVAAAEMGVVAELHVREGDPVKIGQLLATLDQDVYRAQLAIAEKALQSKGAFESVTAELAIRRKRLTALELLEKRGHARPEEVDRARADVMISEANLLAVEEERELKELELQKIQVQIERRNIRSRSDGVVTKVHRDVGEFVPPNDPVVVTVVQLNPLALPLSVSRSQAMQLRPNQKVMIIFEATQTAAAAVVEFVSPITDAESNTVAVRLRIDNPDGRFRSGDRCTLDVRTATPRSPTQAAASQRIGG